MEVSTTKKNMKKRREQRTSRRNRQSRPRQGASGVPAERAPALVITLTTPTELLPPISLTRVLFLPSCFPTGDPGVLLVQNTVDAATDAPGASAQQRMLALVANSSLSVSMQNVTKE